MQVNISVDRTVQNVLELEQTLKELEMFVTNRKW